MKENEWMNPPEAQNIELFSESKLEWVSGSRWLRKTFAMNEPQVTRFKVSVLNLGSGRICQKLQNEENFILAFISHYTYVINAGF